MWDEHVTDERRFLDMDDDVRIAVTLHLPDHVPPPWPVVFESRPYRKDDISDSTAIYRRLCDEGGLAVCRADVRGTGSSGGDAPDEYTQREWDDWLIVIAWLAEQEWSNGSVGMYGTSYSGFNSLQVAALQPPALKAIIPIYATDRRYTDDVHFGGGVRRCLDFLDYPVNMVATNALPPVPAVYGEGWRDEWLRRIDADPWELRWFEEQDEDPYWRHGSVWFGGYERIQAATMIIAGHADGYHNMAFRALERVSGPRQLLFGPWSHMSPRNSLPGPRIDHVPEMIRWWRRWLADEDNGVDREPMVRIFVREPSPPRADPDVLNGRWRAEQTWPPESADSQAMELGGAVAPHGDTLVVRGDVGVAGSIWCAADLPFGLPWDQREDESRSLVFEWTVPGDAELEILGYPRVELSVTSSEPVAFVSAKLCCVHPDGSSELVTRGILNLTHRDGHDAVRALTPGEPVAVAFDLDATAFAFPPGSRFRLDIAGSDFSSSWPPPSAGTLAVDRSASRLLLPVVAPSALDPPTFAPGLPAPHHPDRVLWEVRHDVIADERRVVIDHGGVRGQGASGVEILDSYGGEVGVRGAEPGVAWARGGTTYELVWPEVAARAESRGTLRTDASTWYLELELKVFENGELIAERRWERTAPRHLQ